MRPVSPLPETLSLKQMNGSNEWIEGMVADFQHCSFSCGRERPQIAFGAATHRAQASISGQSQRRPAIYPHVYPALGLQDSISMLRSTSAALYRC